MTRCRTFRSVVRRLVHRTLRDTCLMTTADWSAPELVAIDGAEESRIAVRRQDGSLRPMVAIWVVSSAGQVYTRTWHRRDPGRFGRLVSSRRARVVGDVVADVVVEDVGVGSLELRAAVDAAHRGKYAHYGRGTLDRMVSEP
jgi:hypothetical protein